MSFAALGRLDFFESALAFIAGYGLRAFLIAQSLNQIEKAYGPNNSILDNCHVRMVFSSNDERTAKRISDALGTATEQRAQRNYAGHRLSPWLGHLMVSRQETARPLRTPGEVMQLPPDDEVVMVSGQPPIRAQESCAITRTAISWYGVYCLRRCWASGSGYADRPAARPDDWTGLARPQVGALGDGVATGSAEDGGREIRPELAAEEIVVSPDTGVDLTMLDEDDDLPLPIEPDRRLQRTARLAALDPDDGIPL